MPTRGISTDNIAKLGIVSKMPATLIIGIANFVYFDIKIPINIPTANARINE